MSYPEYELDMEMVERQRLKELVRVRSKPLSIDIETTSVEDFKDLTGVIANVIVVWDSVSPMKKWVFVQDEALHLNDVLPMSALRNHLIEWLKRGRVLGGQNILGFDFPVMMDDDNLKVKDVLQAFIGCIDRAIADESIRVVVITGLSRSNTQKKKN